MTKKSLLFVTKGRWNNIQAQTVLAIDTMCALQDMFQPPCSFSWWIAALAQESALQDSLQCLQSPVVFAMSTCPVAQHICHANTVLNAPVTTYCVVYVPLTSRPALLKETMDNIKHLQHCIEEPESCHAPHGM